MKLSKKGEYALKAVQYLSLNYERDVVQVSEISERERIPTKFLEQILLALKKAGILHSKAGVGGGYRLARPPEKISLGQVLRVIDGPLAPVGCVSQMAHKNCAEEDRCSLRGVMLEVRNAICQVLDRVTFQEICERAWELEEKQAVALSYEI